MREMDRAAVESPMKSVKSLKMDDWDAYRKKRKSYHLTNALLSQKMNVPCMATLSL